jgi:hypothetical protein
MIARCPEIKSKDLLAFEIVVCRPAENDHSLFLVDGQLRFAEPRFDKTDAPPFLEVPARSSLLRASDSQALRLIFSEGSQPKKCINRP